MKQFLCDCGTAIFFDNTYCSKCGSELGFLPDKQMLVTLQPQGDCFSVRDEANLLFRACEHRVNQLQCNWLIPAQSSDNQCISCRTTRTVPTLNKPENWWRWRTLESTKRRLFYSLLGLHLPIKTLESGFEGGLAYDFLEDQATNPDVAVEHVYTGHLNGVITVNVAEVDGSHREAAKEAMNEHYRTLLGHFRHEIGHFYWDQLIKNTATHASFKQLFGDESLDYRSTLDAYYQNGPRSDWQDDCISPYASAHPLEDWAETWAHYMLMMETLETAQSYGLTKHLDDDWVFEVWIAEWVALAVVLNALNRSTGASDAYPFVLSQTVKKKLKFIHEMMLAISRAEEFSA